MDFILVNPRSLFFAKWKALLYSSEKLLAKGVSLEIKLLFQSRRNIKSSLTLFDWIISISWLTFKTSEIVSNSAIIFRSYWLNSSSEYSEINGVRLTRDNYRDLLFNNENNTYTIKFSELSYNNNNQCGNIIPGQEDLTLVKSRIVKNPVHISKVIDVEGVGHGYP